MRTCATVLFPCLYRSPAGTARSNTSVCPHARDSGQSLSNAKNIKVGSFYGASQIGYSLPASKSILHARFSSQQPYLISKLATVSISLSTSLVSSSAAALNLRPIPATQSSLTCCCAYNMIDSWKHEPSRSTRRW